MDTPTSMSESESSDTEHGGTKKGDAHGLYAVILEEE
jgi:hypothetical protein